MTAVWIDGRFVEDPAIAASSDGGYQLGWGVFETLGAQGGRLPLWDRHLARLRRGADVLGLPFEPPVELERAAAQLLRRTARADGVLRINLTAATASGGATWCMTTRVRGSSDGPVRLHVADDLRRSPGDPTAAIKCTSRAFYVLAARRAREAGADDALLLDVDGRVLETCVANVLFRAGGRYCSPRWPAPFVPGVALGVLADALGELHRDDFDLAALRSSDAIWVTNAVHGPRPALLPGGPPAAAAGELTDIWRAALDR